MKKLIEIIENAHIELEEKLKRSETLKDYYCQIAEERAKECHELREERDAIAAERNALITAAARTNDAHQRRITDLEEECEALSGEVADLRAKVYSPVPGGAPSAVSVSVDPDAVRVDPGVTAYLDKVQEVLDGDQ